MSGQATLSDIAGEEGATEADAGREPGGSDPDTTFPYPDLTDPPHAGEVPDGFEWVPHSERDEGPNNAKRNAPICPVCGEVSSKRYACSECGKLFDGGTTHATTDTAVGG